MPSSEPAYPYLFHSLPQGDIGQVAKSGIRSTVLLNSLSAAARLGSPYVLVVQFGPELAIRRTGTNSWWADHVPPEAILNLDPYAPPREITAAGGIVLRTGDRSGEVLVIYRGGVWDLPKGKLDASESIADCAQREVQEESSAAPLHPGPLLGTTVHGYRRKGEFHIKTTYWYVLWSNCKRFTPQLAEEIKEVKWMAWRTCRAKTGLSGAAPLTDTNRSGCAVAWPHQLLSISGGRSAPGHAR